ncbi:MAG TPA: ribosome assembly RNA-binding protein YhbY [Firmicutes bacterium]|nr:ribosome assembly RNA-binding protein YhbY [Bacillota bacterium]
MLTSKERARLRGLANELPVIIQVGKGGISDNLVRQIDEALEARELVKLRLLQNVEEEPEEMAETLANLTQAEVVQVIGKVIVLYRPAKDNQNKGGIADL